MDHSRNQHFYAQIMIGKMKGNLKVRINQHFSRFSLFFLRLSGQVVRHITCNDKIRGSIPRLGCFFLPVECVRSWEVFCEGL